MVGAGKAVEVLDWCGPTWLCGAGGASGQAVPKILASGPSDRTACSPKEGKGAFSGPQGLFFWNDGISTQK